MPGITGLLLSPGDGTGETEEEKVARLLKEKEEAAKKLEEEELAKKKEEEETLAKLKAEQEALAKKKELEKKKLDEINDIAELKKFFTEQHASLQKELAETKKKAFDNETRYKQKERESLIGSLTDADKKVLQANDYDISKMDTASIKLAKTLFANKKKMLGNEGNPGFEGAEATAERLKRLNLI